MIILSMSINHMTYGYVSRIVPFERIGEITKVYNYSASAFRGGHRHGDKVTALGNVMIYDFDGHQTSGTDKAAPVCDGQETSGINKAAPVCDGSATLDEMEAFLRENGVTSVLATSRSHQKEKRGNPPCDRFRLFLPLHRQLKIDIADYSAFYTFVAEVFDIDDAIDASCKDASRFYWPNPDQIVRYIKTGWILDADILEKNFYAVKKAREADKTRRAPDVKANYAPAPGRRKNEVSRDTLIELKNGETRRLYEFDYLEGDETVPCRCINPNHEDRHPSAFIGRSRTGGGLQVTCSACGYTAYMERETSRV